MSISRPLVRGLSISLTTSLVRGSSGGGQPPLPITDAYVAAVTTALGAAPTPQQVNALNEFFLKDWQTTLTNFHVFLPVWANQSANEINLITPTDNCVLTSVDNANLGWITIDGVNTTGGALPSPIRLVDVISASEGTMFGLITQQPSDTSTRTILGAEVSTSGRCNFALGGGGFRLQLGQSVWTAQSGGNGVGVASRMNQDTTVSSYDPVSGFQSTTDNYADVGNVPGSVGSGILSAGSSGGRKYFNDAHLGLFGLCSTGLTLQQQEDLSRDLLDLWEGVTGQSLTPPPPPPPTYFNEVDADSPDIMWDLSETSGVVANDVISGYDGEFIGSPSLNQAGPSPDIPSILLNGSTQYVGVIPRLSALSSAPCITIETIIKTPESGDSSIVTSFINSNLAGFSLTVQSGSIRISGRSSASGAFKSFVGPSVGDGNWHHIVAKMNYADDSMSLYVDGTHYTSASVGFDSTSYQLGTPSEPTRIGSHPTVASLEFDGNLCEVILYAHDLPDSRISAHFSATGI